MSNEQIIELAISHYCTHKEVALIEAMVDEENHLNWIANAQKELKKLLGA